ncbi:MAG: hypothetical protein ACRC78_09195, partial [Planktothrix sp.]
MKTIIYSIAFILLFEAIKMRLFSDVVFYVYHSIALRQIDLRPAFFHEIACFLIVSGFLFGVYNVIKRMFEKYQRTSGA